MTKNAFRKFVITFVTLIGAGFGTWAGFLYERDLPFHIGTLVGLVSSLGLAILYLKILDIMSIKGHKKMTIFLLGTVIAILCGVVCTTLIHGIIIETILARSAQSFYSYDQNHDGFTLLVIGVAEMIGAAAGLIAGGICSFLYVSEIMGKANEARGSA